MGKEGMSTREGDVPVSFGGGVYLTGCVTTLMSKASERLGVVRRKLQTALWKDHPEQAMGGATPEATGGTCIQESDLHPHPTGNAANSQGSSDRVSPIQLPSQKGS